MHTPVWIKIGMALGFAYLAIFTIDLVGDMLGGPEESHGGEHAEVADASHDADAGHAVQTAQAEEPAHAEEAAPAEATDHAAPTEHAAEATEAGEAAETATEAAEVVALVGDIAAGKKTSKKCASCHSFDDGGPNKVGPNLFGLAARGRAAAEGYKYSPALKSMGGSWTDADLDAFLADPKAFAPGTKMSLKLRKEQDRANVIAFLNSLH